MKKLLGLLTCACMAVVLTMGGTGCVKDPKKTTKPAVTTPVKPKTDDAKPKTDDAKPKTDDAKPKTDDAKPKTDDAKPKTDDAKPKTDDAKPKTDKAKTDKAKTVPDPKKKKTDDSFNFQETDRRLAYFSEPTAIRRHSALRSRQFIG